MSFSRRSAASGVAAVSLVVAGLLVTAIPARAQEAPQGPGQWIVQAIDQTACDPAKLSAAITALVTANPTSAVDVVTYATQHCPADAAGIAAAAASVDPTDAAAILVAVVASLPPDQAETELAAIVVAVETAVPGAADQITTAISQITFNQGPGLQGRGDKGAPLIAPWTDVPNQRITSNSPI